MKLLFLDDQQEILQVYRLILDPNLAGHGDIKPSINLFASDKIPAESADEEEFVEVVNGSFNGTFHDTAVGAVQAFKNAHDSPLPYRIAVLDMQLPESSGLEVAKSLLRMQPDVHIVFITAYSDYNILQIARELGVGRTQFLFLKKPFELQEVIQSLLYLTERIHTDLWQRHALQNLMRFNRGAKQESLQIIKNLTEADDVGLIRSEVGRQIDSMLQRNGRVMGLVESTLHTGGKLELITCELNNLLEEFRHHKRVKVDVENAPDNLRGVLADPASLTLTLRALLRNSLDYSTDPVHLTVTGQQAEHWEFALKDWGEGIDKEVLQEVFEPGISLQGRGKKKSGFGLALVKRIIMESHRAPLKISSKPGKGTIIKFRLKAVAITDLTDDLEGFDFEVPDPFDLNDD